MNEQPFIIERIYNAPIAKVWEAITDPAKMKEWYFDIADFKAEVGHQFSFMGGDECKQYQHLCTVTEVEKEKKLAYTWKYAAYEGNSIVLFELFDEGNDRTRLRLTHSGLETFPKSDPNFARESFSAGWNHILGSSLPKYLEG